MDCLENSDPHLKQMENNVRFLHTLLATNKIHSLINLLLKLFLQVGNNGTIGLEKFKTCTFQGTTEIGDLEILEMNWNEPRQSELLVLSAWAVACPDGHKMQPVAESVSL